MKKETYDIYKEYQPKREELSAKPIRTAMRGSEDAMRETARRGQNIAGEAQALMALMNSSVANLYDVAKEFEREGDSIASREIEANADHSKDTLRDFRNAVNSYLASFESVATMVGERIRYIK